MSIFIYIEFYVIFYYIRQKYYNLCSFLIDTEKIYYYNYFMNPSKFLIDNIFLESPLNFGELNLIQIGRRFLYSDTKIERHIHGSWFELTIITGGTGIIHADNHKAEVGTGDIFLSFPAEMHDIVSVDNLQFDFYSFFYKNGVFASKFMELAQNNNLKENRIIQDEKINFLVNNAISVFVNNDKYLSDELLKSIFTQISVYILKNFNNADNSSITVTDNQILSYQIMNYIDTNIYSIRSLKDVSDFLGYSYVYLSSVFKKTTGKTISEYYQDRRLKTATLLLSESKKIKTIAEMLGYQDQFSFSKAFKKKYGKSPKKVNITTKKNGYEKPKEK